jgi:endonuclease G
MGRLGAKNDDLKGVLMKKAIKLFLFLSIISVLSLTHPTLAAPASSEHVLYGYPSTTGTILVRKGYVLDHDNTKKVATWVSYHLTDAYLVPKVPRSNDFRPDLDLPVGQRAELKDYKNSDYDRGHQCPAEDMRRSAQTESESFLLSNMTPQNKRLNEITWKKLEDKVRAWAKKRHNLYVMTGPIFIGKNIKTIGPDKVAVPIAYYKIVVSCNTKLTSLDAITFIMPNKDISGTSLEGYISTINEVEKETDLSFLNKLAAAIRKPLEIKKAAMWN